ncbi:MAG: beta-galactosidase, partial [Clostridia bacterium]|nr:beta-galactosidase [Clostridia bacterium]
MDKLLFGAAYYDEYMPHERLAKDVEMMKRAGMNVVRIAESTWSTCEPQEGEFDFSHVERVMDAMEEAGISVIIGTPTYAIPTWMVKSHPDVLAETKKGRGKYGPRQIMDISHPVYRYYAERMIRELMKRTAHRTCVIGFQIDNETKHYGTAGRNVQEKFVKSLRAEFHDDLDAMNHAFGLDYWSNRINAWEDFPNVLGTINGSLGAAFEKFQRTLVTDFLYWQA